MTNVKSIEASRAGPDRRQRQRRETRERIYRAAIAEFKLAGFPNAQIDRIVEAAGVARGTFYFHFPSKEHVLLELQRRTEARIVEHLRSLFASPGSVKEALLGVVEAIAVGGAEVGDPALSRELMAMYVRAPRLVDVSENRLVVSLVDFFADAAERDEVRGDIPPEEIANIFLTALFGFVSTAVDSLAERAAEFGRIIDVFVRGLEP